MAAVPMRRVLRPVPVIVLLAGAALHLAALVGFKLDDEPLWTDGLFLGIDAALAGLLIARIRWAYWVAVLLFGQQLAVQGYWAVVAVRWSGSLVGVQQAAAILCVVGLLGLLSNRRFFTRRPGGDARAMSPRS